MEMWLYVSKRSIKKGGPRWAWLRRCRWYYLKREDSERFKVALEAVEGRGCPMVPLGNGKSPEGYLVLKITPVREILGVLVPDLVYHACLSEERIYSLEDGDWIYEQVKVSPRLWALYLVGLRTTSNGSFEKAKEMFNAFLKEGVVKGKGENA
jgi:hypothetical protein